MKLLTQRLSILVLSAGILFPTSVLSQTIKQFESSNRQQPILLAQQTQRQPRGDEVEVGIAQFKSSYHQLSNASTPQQQMQILQSLIAIAGQNTQIMQAMSNYWQQQASVARTQQVGATLSQVAQYNWKMSETYAGWSQTLPKLSNALHKS
jgi:hypothetical protein